MDVAELSAEIDKMIGQLAGFEPDPCSGGELAELVLANERFLSAVTTYTAVVGASFAERGDHGEAASPVSWIAARTMTDPADVRTRLRVGRTARQFPDALAAARQGLTTFAHLRLLDRARRHYPSLALRDADLLSTLAEQLPARDFATAMRAWHAAAADECSDPADPPPDPPQQELFFSQTLDGTYQLSGRFGLDDGALIAAALDAEVDRLLRAARDSSDPSVTGRTMAEIRAMAVVNVIAQGMRDLGSSSVPDRYRVAVVINADAPPEPTSEAAIAWCDSTAYRLVVNAKSEILDVGRSTKTWPAAIRRAIVARDGHCVFPGCDRPASWCDVHHIVHWEHGGTTSLDSGALACGHHHRWIHRMNWTITIDQPGGKPVVRKPDGTPYTITRWQP